MKRKKNICIDEIIVYHAPRVTSGTLLISVIFSLRVIGKCVKASRTSLRTSLVSLSLQLALMHSPTNRTEKNTQVEKSPLLLGTYDIFHNKCMNFENFIFSKSIHKFQNFRNLWIIYGNLW